MIDRTIRYSETINELLTFLSDGFGLEFKHEFNTSFIDPHNGVGIRWTSDVFPIYKDGSLDAYLLTTANYPYAGTRFCLIEADGKTVIAKSVFKFKVLHEKKDALTYRRAALVKFLSRRYKPNGFTLKVETMNSVE